MSISASMPSKLQLSQDLLTLNATSLMTNFNILCFVTDVLMRIMFLNMIMIHYQRIDVSTHLLTLFH